MHLRRACKAHQLYGPGEDGETNPALPLTPDVLDPSTGEIDPVGLFRPESPGDDVGLRVAQTLRPY